MEVVAVIPARGGSVGLPGKNIRPLNGVPLIGRTIRAARDAGTVGDVYVTSDSEEILAVAKQFGALAIKRPDELAGPAASSEAALVHALGQIEHKTGARPDVLVFLQCTSPFTSSVHIDGLVRTLLESGADSALTVIEDHGFLWGVQDDGSAAGITHDPTLPRQRRQDMAARYRENGAAYAVRVDAFLKSNNRFCGRTVLFPVDAPALEIDSPEDWSIAELLAAVRDRRSDKPAGKIKAFVTDFDGVHTDDRVIVGHDGSEFVICSRADGYGLELLRQRGLRLMVLSRELNPVVRARAAKLQMEVHHGISDKLTALDTWRQTHGYEWSEIAFMGNDLPDIGCMNACGLSFCPGDAHPKVQSVASIVVERAGGHGALRQACEYLLQL